MSSSYKRVIKKQGYLHDHEIEKKYSKIFSYCIFQGTDITEAFESHHISQKPREFLKTFYVRDAVDPRNYFFTYDETGFYQTLKKRVASKLKTVDTSVIWKSRFIHDVNLFGLFFAAIMMNRSESQHLFLFWNFLAAQFLAWSVNFSHNFLHQADNWRMLTTNISLLNWRDCRVSHVLVRNLDLFKKESLFLNHFSHIMPIQTLTPTLKSPVMNRTINGFQHKANLGSTKYLLFS